jgi:nitroreductase
MQTVIDGIMSRRSIRQFTGESIKEEDLNTIIKAGMAAPSAKNIQPWDFIIVTDRTILNNLCEALPYAKMLEKAGIAIIVCGDSKEENWVVDCAAATENILLAAHALGYGAVWTAVYKYESRIEPVRKECKIPKDMIPLNVIPIGVLVEKNNKPLDKYKESKIHRNVW